MKRESLMIIGLLIAFLCGWAAPRSRYQLFRYETDNPKLFLNAIRMDTWTGEIQTIFTMPDPSGKGTIGDYWNNIYVIKDQKTANGLYELRKKYQQTHSEK